MPRHLADCLRIRDPLRTAGRSSAAPTTLHQIRVQSPEMPVFWLDLEVRGTAKLERLDAFLRRPWLECCGHMSAFRMARVDYAIVTDRNWRVARREERSMNVAVNQALPPIGSWFGYEYDFGSTTELGLLVWGRREGSMGRKAVRLLARNDPPAWQCAVCGKPALRCCPYCRDQGDWLFCEEHAALHPCMAEIDSSPVVNSPRVGVCGYPPRF